MKALATRYIALGIALMLAVSPALAQNAPDGSATDQPQQAQGQDQDQNAPPADDTSSATPVPTPASADVAAVIAQWGAAPSIGPEADRALAQRWFREQNSKRARWGAPTAMRDPYLDWQAENLLRDHLGQPQLPQPPGLTRPSAAAKGDQAIYSQTEFWTVSDDLWLAYVNSVINQPVQGDGESPVQPQYTLDNYLQLFKWQETPRFDRFRLIGVAGRVDTSGSRGTGLLSGEADDLDQIASGANAAYAPVSYPDNLVAVVGYDPWINPDGTLRQ